MEAFRMVPQHKAIPETNDTVYLFKSQAKLNKTVANSSVHLDPIRPCLSS